MALRTLPYRNYNEHDVINAYALADAHVNSNLTGTGPGDAGVFVTVDAGNLDLATNVYGTDSYLGKQNYPFVGSAGYPSVSLKVKPAVSGDIATIGLTLRQTCEYDENGEKLLYYRQKAEENQVTIKGHAVPIVSRGEFMLSAAAFDGTLTPGNSFKLSANSGKISGCANSDTARLGLVLGTGSRGSNGAEVADLYSGNYALIKLGL